MKKVIGIPALVLMLGVFLMGCGEDPDDSIMPADVGVQNATELVSIKGEIDAGVSNASEEMSLADDPWNNVYGLDMKSLYKNITKVEDADNFEGEWKATDCLYAVSGNFDITDQTSDGFSFTGDFLYGYRTGQMEGVAHFVAPNMAICNQDDVAESMCDEGYMVFYLENGSLYVNSDFGLGSMGMSVTPNNKYTQGEPVYKSDDNLDTYTQDELDSIRELIGDEAYKYPFLECTETFILESSEKTLESGITCKYVECYFSDMPERYTAILSTDGRIYLQLNGYKQSNFYTNDASWTSKELPKVS
ncbi:MAG: hypothetical protein IKO84_08965 [Butyrivibrio sp.]|nr:hypothetical protein [Butyrivibrio sp.]